MDSQRFYLVRYHYAPDDVLTFLTQACGTAHAVEMVRQGVGLVYDAPSEVAAAAVWPSALPRYITVTENPYPVAEEDVRTLRQRRDQWDTRMEESALLPPMVPRGEWIEPTPLVPLAAV